MPESGAESEVQAQARARRTEITLVPGNVWRVGMVVIAVAAFGSFLAFLISDGGTVIFTVLMSWFAALAMQPAVNPMSRHMRRGAATGLVMLAFLLLVVVFVVAFGALLVDQLTQFIARIPELIDATLTWINATFSLDLTLETVLSGLGGGGSGSGGIDFGKIASQLGPTILGIVGSVVTSVFSLFTFGLFTFYFSAQMPQLFDWVARLFPSRQQGVVSDVWRLTAQKTGGYVGARVVLGTINAVTTGIVFAIIGMPYWLPLAIWTGVVAQFVPTIGTYIAIILPVLVGALSPTPWLGLAALAWGLLYQQVENLTIEPKISAKAVDVNPAVSFGAVLLGGALFGVAGAFLAVPVVAMLLALLELYARRYDLADEVAALHEGVDDPDVEAAETAPA